jgi:hypothetical protein
MEVWTCKVVKLTRFINNWGAQAKGLSELGVNWGTYPLSENLALWFRDDIPDMRAHTAHNSHKKVDHRQLNFLVQGDCLLHSGLYSWMILPTYKKSW